MLKSNFLGNVDLIKAEVAYDLIEENNSLKRDSNITFEKTLEIPKLLSQEINDYNKRRR